MSNPGPEGLRRIQSDLRGANWDFASISPGERRNVRHPIIINGAGPAGLLLAIDLQSAKIPFEICESERHDLESRSRRNHASLLSRGIFRPMREFLRIKDPNLFADILNNLLLNCGATAEAGAKNRLSKDQYIHTESLMELLRRQVPVNYGLRLDREGISCRESLATYNTGRSYRTFEGSLLVGADGLLSQGK